MGVSRHDAACTSAGADPRAGIAAATLALACLAGACAPLPPPGQSTAPAQTRAPAQPRPAGPPVQTRPAALHLDGEPSIDVGVAWDEDTLAFGAVRKSITWRMGRSHDRAAGRADSLVVTLTGGRAELRAPGLGDGVRATAAAGETLWIGEPQDAPLDPSPQQRWRGKTWRGQVKVFVNPRGTLTLALRLPLEGYLTGVVPGEIGALSPTLLEAGRAQAIAARSYTLYYRGRRAAEGFDLYGTVEDQLYSPVESERPLATRCVETTRGQVDLYDDRPIRANYYSTCGGVTADAWEGFTATGFPYLASTRDGDAKGDYCARSPQFRWREEWDAADFLATLERYAPPEGIPIPARGLGDLVDVRTVSRSRSGRVWVLEVATTTGTMRIPAYSIRRVLRRPKGNGAILRSNLFKIDVRRDPGTGQSLGIVVSGAGSGHGVGLCQTGALGMAGMGSTGEQILDHYYPGATTRRCY